MGMRLIEVGLALGLALAGCAKVETAWQNATTATITTNTVYTFEEAYIAIEATATNYVALPSCSKAGAPKICSSDAAVAKIVPAVRSLRAANDALVQVQKNHPEQLGSSGVFDTAKAAYSVLLQTLSNYGVTGK